MTAPHAQAILDGYMARLDRELEGVNPTEKADLLNGVKDHITEARRLLKDESDSDLLNVLDRLGSPAELASALRERQPEEPTRGQGPRTGRGAGLVEVAALAGCILLLPLGLILSWVSTVWTSLDKLIAIAIPVALVLASLMSPTLFRAFHPIYPFAFHPIYLILLMMFTPIANPVGLICAAFLGARLWRYQRMARPST
jgi:uncharacterized membrane protein